MDAPPGFDGVAPPVRAVLPPRTSIAAAMPKAQITRATGGGAGAGPGAGAGAGSLATSTHSAAATKLGTMASTGRALRPTPATAMRPGGASTAFSGVERVQLVVSHLQATGAVHTGGSTGATDDGASVPITVIRSAGDIDWATTDGDSTSPASSPSNKSAGSDKLEESRPQVDVIVNYIGGMTAAQLRVRQLRGGAA